MKENFLVITTAGKGIRSNLNFPKSLYVYNKKPLLINIIDKFKQTRINIKKIIIVVSPKGKNLIISALKKHKIYQFCEIITQHKPLGMGNAIMQLKKSKYLTNLSNIYLIWGDLADPQVSTFIKLKKLHEKNFNHFSFATINSLNPYTRVIRNKHNKVIELLETKNQKKIKYGERDIGVFLFKLQPVLIHLLHSFINKTNITNYEYSFLQIVKVLVYKGYTVEGYNIASKNDMKSLNRISDLK
jgi:bifunctional N-acetylglucosamine-1-phosphate-uridyltransferase/glucosamine-1-phosphate-acetyltransferase GlmU-like protein